MQRFADVVGAGTTVRARAFPAAVAVESLAGVDGIVVGGRGWRLPDLPSRSAAVATLQQYIERGGRVLLLGYAVALCKDLGIDPRTPDLVEPFRWGFDSRTAAGSARLGFELVSGRAPELVDGMHTATGHEHGYFLRGGAPLCTPMCVFAAAPPARGEVLGQLLRQRDDVTQALAAAVLTRWRLGKGQVLGLGLEPDLDAAEPELQGNAAAFTQKAVQWLGGERAPRRLEYWLLDDPTPAPLPARWPTMVEREVPGASLLAHWGMVAAVHDGAVARSPEQVQDDVLLPTFAAGADLLSLDLVDREQGLPLPWGEHDPLARPPDYRGSAFARGWNGDSVPKLLGEAHARGVIVQALLDPPPGGDSAPARLASLRYLAREWCDLRRFGDRTLDGIGLRQWFHDERGLAGAMLQDFQPGAHVVRIGEGVKTLAGAVAAVDARDGRPLGGRAFGFAAGYRDGFPGDQYPVGYLDCTALRPLSGAGAVDATGYGHGGGSFGDWIAVQAADFVRARRDRGGAMLWDAHAPSLLGTDTLAYVNGVSAEPLVAAVAARCTTIGQDGWRAAQRELLEAPPPGFGAGLAVPAATVMLTNNHLRLCGSGGPLLFDCGGLGRFDAATTVRLGDAFYRTRFYGGRPDADELRSTSVDLLATGRRGEGSYGARFVGVPGGSVPTTIAFGAAPRWPQCVDLPIGDDVGQYEVRIEARPISGQGLVAIGVDDAVLTILPFQDGRLSIQRTLTVHLAKTVRRSLRIEVLDGGALALDRLVVTRKGDVGAEAEVLLPAGSLASLRERSASTYHAETVELTTVADCPAVLLRSQCERAVRGLQQERRFGLRLHRTLRASGDGGRELRRPFVLASDDPNVPDLAVVPLQLARYEYFQLDDGQLVLRNQPEPGTSSLIGFAFLPNGEAVAALPSLAKMFTAFDRPQALGLADGGLAELRADVTMPWSRVVAITQPARTPFLVRENGWWTWRGTQAQPGDPTASLLRVCQLPGDVVQIVGSQSLLLRTRPGPGAVHTVALRDPTPTEVTARVLQVSALATPCVTMGGEFDEVFLDDRPWGFYRGATIALPNRVGTYRITTRRHGGAPLPHVLASGAVFEHCAFEPATGDLVLAVAADASRPPELPFTAVLAGPRPHSIDGGQLVDEKDLRHATAGARVESERAGTVIRFRPGLVRVHYGQ